MADQLTDEQIDAALQTARETLASKFLFGFTADDVDTDIGKNWKLRREFARAVLREERRRVEGARSAAGQGVPVAHVDMQARTGDRVKWTGWAIPHGTPLYTHPSEAMEVLRELEAAVRAFRNEPLLKRLTGLRGTPGYQRMQNAWDDAVELIEGKREGGNGN